MDAVITCFEAIENELKPSRQDEMNSLLLVQIAIIFYFKNFTPNGEMNIDTLC